MNQNFDRHLGGMADIPQFFLWRLEWKAAQGKYSKTPCALDGSVYRVDASLPANWTDYDTAQAALAKLPRDGQVCHALGFWLTSDCGYWLLDIDKCAVNGQWSTLAQQLLAAYPGAKVEASSSRNGLHVIGMGDVQPHRCRDVHGLGLEFYTRDRGIAFGLTQQAQGCADTQFDMRPLVDAYFPPRAERKSTGECMPEWRGPSDDDALIQRMLAARVSAAATFGGKASLAQLWRGEASKDSSNDFALASHLAWWTGADAERIERIMRRSGLVRPKWDERRSGGTYLSGTITNACEGCEACYQEPAQVIAPPLSPVKPGTIRNATDLLRQEFKPVQWAIRDILPEGVSIISGDPKIGKSFLVYQMCLAIATGSPIWYGKAAETLGDSLYLSLEDNDRRLRRRLDKLLLAFPGKSPDRLHYSTEWPRAEAGVAAIAEWLREHPKCRLVVIDTISAFRDSDPGRKSAYAHDYAVGEMLKPLAREFSCAIVLVMHNRKLAAGDVMHKVSGTQGMTGSVDNVLILERTRGDSDAILHVDGRDIEQQQELALRLNGGVWSFLGNADDVNRTKERSEILETMASLKGHGTAKEIHEAMGGRVRLAAVRMRLSRMHKAGELDCNGGIYTVPNPADKFTPTLPPLPGIA